MAVLARASSAAGDGEAVTMGGMTESAVHRTADPPVPVLVEDVDGTWPGLVLGWRGDRVYVRYSEGPGLNHLTWVEAEQVQRV